MSLMTTALSAIKPRRHYKLNYIVELNAVRTISWIMAAENIRAV